MGNVDKDLPKFGGVEWLLYFCSMSLSTMRKSGMFCFYTNERKEKIWQDL